VKIVEYTSGSALKIVYLDCGDSKRDLDSFLDEIERTRQNEYNQLRALLDKTAKYGPSFNNYRTKRLHGQHAKPLCEFCGGKEARIIWFADKDNDKIIVCTHGFIGRGNHDHRADIDRAQIRRSLYYEQRSKSHGNTDRKELSP
jgi:hypothetical protein